MSRAIRRPFERREKPRKGGLNPRPMRVQLCDEFSPIGTTHSKSEA